MAKKTPKAEKYGRLTVLLDTGKRDSCRGKIVLCRCECGIKCEARMKLLRNGDKKSCGCLYIETRADLPKSLITHGLSFTPAANRYHMMVARCTNEEHPNYPNYGGRGIRVCSRWLLPDGKGLINFVKDMGQPTRNMALDRIDNEGDYRKSNCRWVNRRTNNNNRRTNVLVSYKGKEITLAQLSRRLCLSYDETYAKYRSKGRVRIEA